MTKMKQMLKESYRMTKKATGIDPSKPGAIREILVSVIEDERQQVFKTQRCLHIPWHVTIP